MKKTNLRAMGWCAGFPFTILACGAAVDSSSAGGEVGAADNSSSVLPSEPRAPTTVAPLRASVPRDGLSTGMGSGWMHGVKFNYRIVNGMAIAGGDMILGRVDGEGKLIDEGVPPPAPPANALDDSQSELFGKSADDSGAWVDWPGWKWPKFDYGAWGMGGCRVSWFPDASLPADYAQVVREAANWFSSNSYCQWVEEWNPEHSVRVIFDPALPSGGQSAVGRNCRFDSNIQAVRCLTAESNIFLRENDYGTVIHEMFHMVGWFHEHQRIDREFYVDVLQSDPDHDVIASDWWNSIYYTPTYDRNSITHYQGGCRWRNFFGACGWWYCWGTVLPNGYAGKDGAFECSNMPGWYEETVGGKVPDYADAGSVRTMYPPPPNLPPPPPPPADPCEGFPTNACNHGSSHECCGFTSGSTSLQAQATEPVFNHQLRWTSGKRYQVGAKVWAAKRWFRAIKAHRAGSKPPSADPTNWRGVYEPARYWRAGIDYPQNGSTEYKSRRYIAAQAHLSTAALNPEAHPELWFALP